MAKGTGAIRVKNLRPLQRELAKAGSKDVVKEVRKANKDAALIVSDKAKQIVPVQSGKLQKSIGAQAQRDSARVKAGTSKGVQYAGPIHWGWPAKGIRPQPFLFDALSDKRDEVEKAYEDNLARIALQLSTNPLRR